MTQPRNLETLFHNFQYRFPRLPSNFLGRQKEVFLILRNFSRSSCHAIHLKGESGIGKSALATYVAEYGLERGIFNSVASFPPRGMPANHNNQLDWQLHNLWNRMHREDRERSIDDWIPNFIQQLGDIKLFLVVDTRKIEKYHETILPKILEGLTKENVSIKFLIINAHL